MAKKGKMKTGKKPHKNKPTSKKYTKYTLEGDTVKRNAPNCPRCGPGIFLMVTKDRRYCGKCHYAEFESKAAQVEATKKEKEEKKE